MQLPDEPVEILMLNGELLCPDSAVLPADMPGVLRGEGIFETFLVLDGAPTPFLDYHQERWQHSAEKMEFDLGGKTLVQEWQELRPHIPAGRFRVRLTLLRARNHKLWRMWTSGPALLPPAEVVLSFSRFRRDPADPLAGVKHISRMGCQLARREAASQGAYEALMPTTEGDWAEGTVSNLFLMQNGVLRTPGVNRGILAGVTRRVILEMAQNDGFLVEEGEISTADLMVAEEVFVTSAIMGVIPVCKIVDVLKPFPGATGQYGKQLSRLYQQAHSLPLPLKLP